MYDSFIPKIKHENVISYYGGSIHAGSYNFIDSFKRIV